MDFNPDDKFLQLSKKHGDILAQRAAVLQQMEAGYEQQRAKKKQHGVMFEAARQRNAQITQDLLKLETRLQTRPLLHPDVVSLQTRYWASVEQKLPEWESYLLGKGQVPVTDETRSQKIQGQRGGQDSSPTRHEGKPPRPKARSTV